jgi:hypothetical protein
MPLMTMSTAVIIVLHSTEVVHIAQESRSSLLTGYQVNTLTHFQGVC